MRILILGGHGFLGHALADHLRRNYRHEVFARSRVDGLDLNDLESTRRCFANVAPNTIVNCAAHVGGVHYVAAAPADVLHDNVVMGLNVYRAARDACPNVHVINPLSNCAYPGDQSFFNEERWLEGDVHPSVYPYGHAKRMHYVASVCYAQQYAIDTLNLLVPNAFGPGDRDDPTKVHALNGMIIRMLRAAESATPQFEIWGTGRPIREWIYVEDVARIIALAASTRLVATAPINLAQNKGVSIADSAQMIADAIGYMGELCFQPEMQDGAPCKIMSDELFRRHFPAFEFIDHQLAIYQTVQHYRQRMSQAALALKHIASQSHQSPRYQ